MPACGGTTHRLAGRGVWWLHALGSGVVGASIKDQIALLGQRGRCSVQVGDLSRAGLDAVVYAPNQSSDAPVVVFAHDWMHGAGSYRETLRHLASWGIVAVAPNTQRGLIPSHRDLVADMSRAIDIVTTTPLGDGSTHVNPGRVGVAGHGMGGGVAVLTASVRTDVDAIAALFPSEVTPPAPHSAQLLDDPVLLLSGNDSRSELDARAIAETCRCEVIHRRLKNAEAEHLIETPRIGKALGLAGSNTKTQRMARAFLTAFFLHNLAGKKDFVELLSMEQEIKGTDALTDEFLLHEGEHSVRPSGIASLLRRG